MWLIIYVYDYDLYGSLPFFSEEEATAEYNRMKEDIKYQSVRLFEQKAVTDRR